MVLGTSVKESCECLKWIILAEILLLNSICIDSCSFVVSPCIQEGWNLDQETGHSGMILSWFSLPLQS
jgi:hypothetical protein